MTDCTSLSTICIVHFSASTLVDPGAIPFYHGDSFDSRGPTTQCWDESRRTVAKLESRWAAYTQIMPCRCRPITNPSRPWAHHRVLHPDTSSSTPNHLLISYIQMLSILIHGLLRWWHIMTPYLITLSHKSYKESSKYCVVGNAVWTDGFGSVKPMQIGRISKTDECLTYILWIQFNE